MIWQAGKIETKERNKHMHYTKPQILTTANAASTILGGKSASMTPDNHAEPFLVTIPAYQADE
jgi:hypothetical protein